MQINGLVDISLDLSVDKYGIEKKIDVLGFPGKGGHFDLWL